MRRPVSSGPTDRAAEAHELAAAALGHEAVAGFVAGVEAIPDPAVGGSPFVVGGSEAPQRSLVLGLAASGRAQTSAADAVERSLAAIAAHEHLNAFAAVAADRARARARALDRAAGGAPTPLRGLTLGVKDCLDVEGLPVTCGALARRDTVAAATAPAVETLEQAGAVVVGMTAMHEWAFGATSSSPLSGQVVNGAGNGLLPGGSSGGSAVAVAAGLVDAALGTDTGGSIRLPASWCGAYGLKVTNGSVSTAGCFPLSQTMDTIGPLARSAETLLDVAQVLLAAAPGRSLRPLGTLRVGVLAGSLDPARLDPLVAARAGAAIARLTDACATAHEVTLPGSEHVFPAQMVIVCSEASAVHGGERRPDRPTYGADVQGLLALGDLVPGSGYVRAQRYRRSLEPAVAALFQQIDVIVSPTTPLPAPPIDGPALVTWPDGTQEGLLAAAIRFLLPVNFLGLPAVSLPCPGDGLPVGLQLIGPPGSDVALVELARELESR